MSYKSDTKFFDDRTKYTVKCKCSHSVVIPNSKDRLLCDYCGYYVYKNKRIEFKYKLREKMNKINER